MLQSKIRRYLKHGTLPQLRVFEAVARHGNFTRAAEELYMAQPTASVQIKKLTETVGMPLFEYVGKRVYPTAAGHELYGACQSILTALESVEETLSDMRGLESGSLHIAASSAGKYLAPRLLAGFVKRHPHLDVSLHLNCRQSVLERLAENRDDLYILCTPPDDDDVVIQRIAPNPLLALAPQDHALSGGRNVSFMRLAEEPLIMREQGSGTRLETERLFARHSLQPRTKVELGSNEAIVEAIRAGMGVAVLYRHSLGSIPEGEGIAILDVEGFPLESYVNFVYPVGKQLSAVAQAFMEFARKETQCLMTGMPTVGRS